MNRTLRAIIIAISLIVVGAVLGGCGLWGMNGAWDQLSGANSMVTTEETVTGDFDNIDIDVFWLDVELLSSADGTCYYKATAYESMPCTVAVENGTLKIRQDDNRQRYQHIGINWNEPTLTLYLPKDAYDQLTISGSTSDLTIPANFRFQSVTATNSTGDIAFSAQVAGDLAITCSTGDINLKGVSAKAITASVSTGDVTMEKVSCNSLSVCTSTGHCYLTDVAVENNLSATSGTGKKVFTNVTCGSLDMESTTGDNELSNVVVSGDAKMESNTGDWELNGFDAANIRIEASTGEVEGRLLSEKVFLVDTSTGDVDVPRGSSGGRCEITTSTGDIDIEIVP